MKVLFLDIDGVVNCETTMQRHRGTIGIDPYMAFLIEKIVIATDCKIVLSSTWRHWPDGKEEVEKQVCKLYDITPSIHKTEQGDDAIRGDEIEAWLSNHPEVKKYAILDDDSDFYPRQKLFRTSWRTGITEEIMNNVIKYLNS